MSSSCPSKYLARAKDKAWITTALRKSSKIKSKLYKKLLEAIHHQDEIKYKQYKRTLRKVALEAEQLPGLATPLAPLKFWIAYLKSPSPKTLLYTKNLCRYLVQK